MYNLLGALSLTKHRVFRNKVNNMLQCNLYFVIAIWRDRCSHKTSSCLGFFNPTFAIMLQTQPEE